MIPRRLLLFLAAGATAALANIGARLLFGLAMPFVPSIVLAWCVGLVTAFLLNRLFVFRDADRTLHHQAFWFVAINLAAVVQTVVISLLLRDWLFPLASMRFHPETIAHAVGVVVPVFTSYIGHKRLTFLRAAGP